MVPNFFSIRSYLDLLGNWLQLPIRATSYTLYSVAGLFARILQVPWLVSMALQGVRAHSLGITRLRQPNNYFFFCGGVRFWFSPTFTAALRGDTSGSMLSLGPGRVGKFSISHQYCPKERWTLVLRCFSLCGLLSVPVAQQNLAFPLQWRYLQD